MKLTQVLLTGTSTLGGIYSFSYFFVFVYKNGSYYIVFYNMLFFSLSAGSSICVCMFVLLYMLCVVIQTKGNCADTCFKYIPLNISESLTETTFAFFFFFN